MYFTCIPFVRILTIFFFSQPHLFQNKVPSIHVQDMDRESYNSQGCNFEIMQRINSLLDNSLDLTTLTATSMPPEQARGKFRILSIHTGESLNVKFVNRTFFFFSNTLIVLNICTRSIIYDKACFIYCLQQLQFYTSIRTTKMIFRNENTCYPVFKIYQSIVHLNEVKLCFKLWKYFWLVTTPPNPVACTHTIRYFDCAFFKLR